MSIRLDWATAATIERSVKIRAADTYSGVQQALPLRRTARGLTDH